MVMYGQVVVGPPGSGKTTYCNGMQQYLRLVGRETLVLNLDPANEYHPSVDDDDDNETEEGKGEHHHLPYDTILDASEDVINLSSVMEELNLGPNGGLVYCMEYIEHHIDDIITLLQKRLSDLRNDDDDDQDAPLPYLLFDFPGQVELYTHNTSVRSILSSLVRSFDLRLAAIHLVDAHSCSDASKFISAALLSTTTMLRLELPAVNVLSKVDLIGKYYGEEEDGGGGGMPFGLDFFMECMDLDRLLPFLDNGGMEEEKEYRILEGDEEYQRARRNTRNSPFAKKHRKLHEQLCEVVDDFSLLSYMPLNINDGESVGRVVGRVDKANGFVFTGGKMMMDGRLNMDGNGKNGGGSDSAAHDMFQCAMEAERTVSGFEYMADVQERFTNVYREEIPELRKERASSSSSSSKI